MPSPLELVELPFMRTATVELALLSIAGGVLGAWIVLRRLAFFTHAVGAAAFPALVAAAPLGVSPQLAGMAAGLGYAAGVERAGRDRDLSVPTALLLVACLASGVVLSSDVVDAPAGLDQLLFGTLLGLDASDLALSAAVAALTVGGTVVLRAVWLASGFDLEGTRALGVPTRATDAALLMMVAVAAVAAVPAVGALLVTSLFIVPAATARLLTSTAGHLLAASVGLAALQSLVGLYLAFALDVAPGPAIAVLGAVVYGAVATGGLARARPGPRRPVPAGTAGASGPSGERAP